MAAMASESGVHGQRSQPGVGTTGHGDLLWGTNVWTNPQTFSVQRIHGGVGQY